MASFAAAEESIEDTYFSRPFHYAFLEKKVVCPESECFKKLLFFEKTAGLGQHYRVIHQKTATDVVKKKASETMRQSYGQETLEYICFLSNRKSKAGAIGMWFDVVSETSGKTDFKTVQLFGENATEVVKYYGMYLKHLGVLKSYGEVNMPCKVMVKWLDGKACFNTWYMKQTMDTRHQGTTVIVECCFVQKHIHSTRALTDPPLSGDLEQRLANVDLTDASNDCKISVLKTVFGHDSFRGKQEEAINAILDGKNCLIVLPTGGGKSVCYSVPAIISGGVTVVICPLLSLMMDQVNMLRTKGLNVCYLNSSVPQSDRDVIMHNMLSEAPDYNFVFITPETATSSGIVDVLSKMKSSGTLTYIVIDECHCIDMWGFDFRPAYASLGILSSLNCQVIALTATCTPRTEEIILSSLNLTSVTTIRQSCDRPNVSLIVRPKKGDGKEQASTMIVNEHKGQCGIVYCTERATTMDMAYCLQTKGVNATYFHGALDPYKKKENFDAWCEGRALVMCATVAFGMGINKADVRFIIHLSIPESIECYAQEFGRAGRDGEESTSCLLFRFEDRTKLLKMISSLPDSEHRSFKIQNLNEMVKFCIMPHCRRIQLVEYFGEGTTDPCDGKCDICLGGAKVSRQDGKDDALHVLSCLENMQRLHPKVTLQHLTLTYRGSKRKEVVAKAYNTVPEFGKGKETFSDAGLKQFIQLLISESVIIECLRDAKDISTTPYLVSGKKEDLLKKGELIVCKYMYG